MEPLHFRRGFTLIELMVVLAIIIVITGLVFSSQSSFNKSLVLANTAYDVALTLHSAQTYGLGSRSSAGMSNIGYGVDFQKTKPSNFTLFADTSPAPNPSNCHGLPSGGASAPDAKYGDCAYQTSEKVVDYTMNNGISISDFCAYTSGLSVVCAVANGGTLSSLDIVFSRPNPNQPFISTNGLYSAAWTKACITIASSQGTSRSVTVTSSGEITTDANSCP
ncbi:MAG: pilus assembly FimT family protein [Minisyncoccota bacterium]